jgi:transcription termination factor NusB
MNTFQQDLKKHIKPFRNSEVEWYGSDELDTDEQLERIERITELLHAIYLMRVRRAHCIWNINNSLAGLDDYLRSKQLNRIDTLNRAITRLSHYYLNQVK